MAKKGSDTKKKKHKGKKIKQFKVINKDTNAKVVEGVNPFERRVNLPRFDVLGRRAKSTEKVLGQSRARSIEKRKQTILVELEKEKKANKFIDQRYGEYNEKLSEEDKVLLRFQKERMKKTKKNNFNLEDEDEGEHHQLTHLGSVITEETEDYIPSEDDVGSDDEFKVTKKKVDGVLPTTEIEGGESGDVKVKKTKKEVFDEIIAKSKMFRAERSKEKERTEIEIEKLDEDLTHLQKSMALPQRRGHDRHEVPEEKDDKDFNEEDFLPPEKKDTETNDFDILLRELAFEARAQPSDRLKTQEEIMQDEKEKLEKLEKERLQRMKPDDNDDDEHRPKKRREPSGDDLEDGSEMWLQNKRKKERNAEEEEGENEEVESSKKALSRKEWLEEKEKEKNNKLETEQNEFERNFSFGIDDEIPFTFPLPSSFEQFTKWIQNRSPTDLDSIISRIRVCNNLTVTSHSKRKIEIFQGFIWMRFFEVAEKDRKSDTFDTLQFFEELDILSKHIYELSQEIKQPAFENAKSILQKIKQSIDARLKMDLQENPLSSWPKLHELLFFKLISNIFPTSDFHHPITTPTLLLMCQTLSCSHVHTLHDIVSALFVCNIVLTYVSISQRFVPEVFSFLTALLNHIATSHTDTTSILPTFSTLTHDTLKLSENCQNNLIPKPIDIGLLNTRKGKRTWKEDKDQFIADLLQIIIQILTGFSKIYSSSWFCPAAFDPVIHLIDKLPNPLRSLKIVIEFKNNIREVISKIVETRKPITRLSAGPVQNAAYIPLIIDPTKNKDIDKIKKLKKQVRRERKGAERELRKDSAFIESERMKKQLAFEKERDEKRRKIMSELEQEQYQRKQNERFVKRAEEVRERMKSGPRRGKK